MRSLSALYLAVAALVGGTYAQSSTASAAAAARTIVITVGGNTTTNASLVFSPQEVTAHLGDTVLFNFTHGNHSAIQSTFASPCIPAHDANITINGFNSGFRDAGNGTAITILPVPILPENVNTTMWFYDANLCGEGGVGVINANESSFQTLAGFERNAIRLNGTAAHSSSASSPTATSPSGTSGGSSSGTSSSPTPSKSNAASPLARGAGLGVGLGLLGLVGLVL